VESPKLLKSVTENELFNFLGIKIESADKEKVVLTMEVTPRVHQYIGIMNGGVSLYLCETAASIGAVLSTDLTKFAPVGIEINANHLRAVSKGIITIEAKPIYAGRTMQVWGIEIKNERGKLVCVSRISILMKKGGAFPVINE
jgi:1,4-dihydroxy-2-naphthoyl-CoA hydrolase